MSDVSTRIDNLSSVKRALLALEMKAKGTQNEPIAIVGMGCRFPGGADDPASFWRLLVEERDALGDVPGDRWDNRALYDADPDAAGKTYLRKGYFVDGFDRFDAEFFGLSPREAKSVDPQQRLLLEVAWEALEHAGQAPDALMGSDTGVFVGMYGNDYMQLQIWAADPTTIDAYTGTGTTHSVAGGRLSHTLGLQGPCVVVDTACSSSLVAVHLAVQALRNGECKLALAGGVGLAMSGEIPINLSRARMISVDGRCKTFDARADGYGRGEGCGVIVLRRLSDALANGDHVLAVIRGSAVNHDGHASSLTAPNGVSQQAVVRNAIAAAGVSPSDVSYVEAHGTGTPLGDPIEVRALGEALCRDRDASHPLLIGSVKTNIGHLEASSGVAGLMKVVLAMQHGELPAHLHLKEVNPHVPLDEFPIEVVRERRSWLANGTRRIAGVSSFGLGGTNAHVVVEEPPAAGLERAPRDRALSVLTLSARSRTALTALAGRFADRMSEIDDAALDDACFTANVGRAHFTERLAVLGTSADDLRGQLRDFAEGRARPGRAPIVGTAPVEPPKVAFLFTGQGSQYAGMARELYEQEPVFREALDECDRLLQPHLDRPLRDVLFGAERSLVDQTSYTQPALFAVEWALASLFRSFGVEPAAVIGHSVGEYVAAVVAGAMSLEDGLRLIARRAQLMGSLPKGGAMAAVFADEAIVRAALRGHEREVAVAAVNGPGAIVVSGREEALARVLDTLAAQGHDAQRLVVSHAFHSPQMDPILDAFEEAAREVRCAPPRIPLVSNRTGEPIEALDARYFRDHLRGAVLFGAGVEALHREGVEVFLEIGPHPTLLGLARRSVPAGYGKWIGALRRGRPDGEQLLEALATLHTAGVNVDWSARDRGRPRRRIALPTYPFQRERYLHPAALIGRRRMEEASREAGRRRAHPLLGDRQRLAVDTVVFEKTFRADDPSFLDDHRLFETVVVPGACYSAMALTGMLEAFGPGVHAVEDLVFPKALVLADDAARRVQLVIEPEAGTFRVFSQPVIGDDDGWTMHATGKVRRDARVDGEGVETTACTEAKEAAAFYEEMWTQGFHLGPAFRWIDEIRRRDGASVVRMRAPSGDEAVHPLHPGLLDSCFQALATALPTAVTARGGEIDDIYIPISVDALRWDTAGATGGALTCHVLTRSDDPSHETFAGDLRVVDASGRCVLEVSALRVQRVPRAALRPMLQGRRDGLHEVVWERAPEPTATDDAVGGWIVLSDEGPVARELCAALRAGGARCVEIRLGADLAQIDADAWACAPARVAEALERALAGGPARGVVHLWSLAGVDDPGSLEAQRRLSGSIPSIVQALLGAGSAARVFVVTRGAVSTAHGEALPSVAASTLWGAGRTLSMEHADSFGALVDLDPAGDAAEVPWLMARLHARSSEDHVARRAGGTLVARLVETTSEARVAAIHGDGAYVITGGLGGLGLEVARWLVRSGARELVLLGRRAPDAQAQAALSELRAHGATLHVAQADVASLDELRRAIAPVVGRVRGVFHSAGVLDDGILLQQDWERFARVLGPKVAGGWNLHLLTEDEPLDHFVLFSSAAAVLGAPAQGNYAAANTFLDALAHHRRAAGRPALSIQWGPWAEVGMAARTERPTHFAIMDSIPKDAGIELLARLLGEARAQLGVLPVSWSQWQRALRTDRVPALLSRLVKVRAASKPRAAAAVSGLSRDELLALDDQARHARLVQHLQALLASVLDLSAAQVTTDKPLNRMGLDSLMAIELKNRIESGLRVKLPVVKLLKGPTLEELATQVLELIGADATPQVAVPMPERPEEVLAQIDQLSETQLDALLQASM